MNKAEAKPIVITFLIISSSPSYISHIIFKFFTIAGFSSSEYFIHKQSKTFQGVFILCS